MWFSSDDTQADASMTYICCSQENPGHPSEAKLRQQEEHFIAGFENYGHQLSLEIFLVTYSFLKQVDELSKHSHMAT